MAFAEGFELRTPRLRLRPYRMDDLDDLLEILGDPETMRFYPHPFTREGAETWIRANLERYRNDGFGLWAMELRETGEFVGNCGPVARTVDGRREVELGWHVNRRWWRRGFASEAAAACRDHALTSLGLDRLIALVRPENLPSRGVAEHIGMSVERTTTHAWLPHLVYALGRPAAG